MSLSEEQRKAREGTSLDDSPTWTTHWWRGSRATRWALRGKLITEDMVEDPPEMKPFTDRGINQDNWLQHLNELTDEEITFLLDREPGKERLDEERKADPSISDRTRAEYLRDF